MASALIIGIGSSGLHIIEEAQQFYYELTGKNKPDGVEYMYIETDKEKNSKNTASGHSNIKKLFISLKNNEVTIKRLRRINPTPSWLPSPETVLNNEKGAGQKSSYGRLALWGNYTEVRNYIQNIYRKLSGNDDTMIYVVGSLSGGTGSGICIDIAYLIKDVTRNNHIYGMFLAPPRSEMSSDTKNMLFVNFINSVAAISKFNDSNTSYKVQWPNGEPIDELRPPYNHIHFISPDFDNADSPLSSIEELYRITGLNLLTRILGVGIRNTDNVPISTYPSVVNATMVNMDDNYKFSTVGINFIQYPKSQLEELFALELSELVISKCNDNKNYFDKTNNKCTINEYLGQLNVITNSELEDVLKDIFELIDGLKSPKGIIFNDLITELATNIIAKDYNGKPNASSFIMDSFSSNNSNNYYSSLTNYDILIRDSVIEFIRSKIVRFMDEYQNIQLTKEKIHIIIKSLDNTIKHWSTYEITSDPNKWNIVLSKQIKSMFDNSTIYSITNQKFNFYFEKIRDIFTLLKMHILIDILNEINIYLNVPSAYLKSNSKNVELPSIKRLNEFSAKMTKVLSDDQRDEEGKLVLQTISTRKSELNGYIDNDTNQIIRLFQYGSKTADLKVTRTNYLQSNENFNLLNVTQNKNLWDYLFETDKLYFDVTTISKKFVEDRRFVSDINIISLIERIGVTDNQYSKIDKFINGNVEDIKRILPAMVYLDRRNYEFATTQFFKPIILTSDYNSLVPLLKEYKAENSYVNIPELQNAIIYIQEYGYMGERKFFDPSKHFGYNKTIVTSIIKKEIDNEHELFFEKRVPYLSKEEFQEFQEQILNN